MRTSASARHHGVDPLALGRALSQLLVNGRIVSGRVDAQHAGGAASGAAHRAKLHGQAAPDRARDRDRAEAEQGRDPRALSEPRTLWRQSRRRACRLAGLFRQGAAPPDARRGGAPGRAAAIAGAAPTRPLDRCRARRPRPRARSRRRRRRRAVGRGRAGKARAGAGRAQADADAGAARRRRGGRGRARPQHPSPHHRGDAAEEPRGARPRARPRARARHLGRDPGGRSCHRRSAGARRLGRLFRCSPRRPGRHDRGGALAGLDAQAVHLWARLRGRPHPSRNADRGSRRSATAPMRRRISISPSRAR